MNKFNLSNIRKLWIDFFISKNHTFFPSQSLVPKNDDSLLWINSGVATLKNFFSGKESPISNRLVSSQRCIRTNDIENVGVFSRHNTFFEMLGNFSIGDYFRKEAIQFAFEFLTKVLNIDSKLLYITVFKDDEESYLLWIKLGILKSHIIKCNKDRNFWEIGDGPCGPCTEIYYDRGEKYDPNKIGEKLFFNDIENNRYIEIWNIVFSEFEKNNDKLTPLARKNIDTGSGLERLCSILQNVPTNYDIDIFENIKKILSKNTSYKYDINLFFEKHKNEKQAFINKSYAVIIDHFRAIVFSISDGVLISNKGRGYILRKLIRRAFFYMFFLNLKPILFKEIVNQIIIDMKDFYPYLIENTKKIIELIQNEYDIYKKAIDSSFSNFIELLESNKLNEESLFHLIDTYGFPLEIITEIEHCTDVYLLNEIINMFNYKKIKIDLKSLNIDFNKFYKFMEKHKEISKSDKKIVAMEKQNSSLLNLDIESKFDYDIFECNSKIVKIFDINFNEVNQIKNEECFLILDKTCFYATSGGQMHDYGTINGFEVIDVFKSPNGQHVHKLASSNFKLNENVFCKIDLNKRLLVSKNHSLEHLLQSVLQKNISVDIKQEGAFKSFEKVTFDFHYDKKLSFDQIQTIENEVQKIIDAKVKKETLILSLDEAKKIGAIAYFEDVYKKIKGKLRVVNFKDFSLEICGGTHVANTKDIETMKIIKIESKGSNEWRIEAISSFETLKSFFDKNELPLFSQYEQLKGKLKKYENEDDELKSIFKINFNKIHYLEKKFLIDKLISINNIYQNKEEKNNEENEIIKLQKDFFNTGKNFIFVELNNFKSNIIFKSLSNAINENLKTIFFVINKVDDIWQYFISCNPIFAKEKNLNFNNNLKNINIALEGKGGGKPNFVQGSFKKYDKEYLDNLIFNLKEIK